MSKATETPNFGGVICDGATSKTSKFGFQAKRLIKLPPSPFVGLKIVTESDWWTVKEVRWMAAESGSVNSFQ